MLSQLEPSRACPWLIAVHGGAGYHSKDAASEKALRRALRLACTSAIEVLRSEGTSSTKAVERAVCTLEDSECLNAGYGSNLTIDGIVECDASIMDGITHDFGSAGAISGVKNPISLARAIMQNSTRPQPLGRIPPLTLVGPGARSFAASSGLETVSPDALISANARCEWERWKTRLEAANASGSKDSSAPDLPDALASATATTEDLPLLEDTVGAVVCDSSGGLSAGVSSGGLLLKYPGRIGEAAVFGAGVWAHSPPDALTGVACSVSGTGEAIIRTNFARMLADALCTAPPEDTHSILRSTLQAFVEKIGERGEEPNVGVLVVMKEPATDDTSSNSESESDQDLPPKSPKSDAPQIVHESSGEAPQSQEYSEDIKLRLWCAFTTESMAIAYASSVDEKPRALILRQVAKRGIYITALPLSR